MKEKIRKREIGIKRKKQLQDSDLYANIDWEKTAKFFRGNLSKASESRVAPLVKDLLHILAAAGAIGLTFAFPGAAKGISSLILGGEHYSRWGTKKVISRLVRQKYVSIKENEDETITVKITKNGLVRALTYQLDTLQLQQPKHWDKIWRVVIFDIPEKPRRLRDLFRMRLRQLGLYPLQESVYVSPYPCFDEVEFLRELYSVAFSVRYLLVKKIEDDEFLRQQFGLSS